MLDGVTQGGLEAIDRPCNMQDWDVEGLGGAGTLRVLCLDGCENVTDAVLVEVGLKRGGGRRGTARGGACWGGAGAPGGQGLYKESFAVCAALPSARCGWLRAEQPEP